MKLISTHANLDQWEHVSLFVFCEDHYWLFVIINQCKKQSPCFEQLYVCVYMCIYIYVYIYVASLGMCFFVIKVQYTPGRYMEVVVLQFVWNNSCPNQIIWKFIYCYYRLCPSRFFQYRLYGSCYYGMVVMVCASNCMEHYLSKPDYMEVYLLLLQIVSKQIFPIQIVWKLLLWNGCYGMHKSLIIDQYFFHYMPIDQWHDPYFFL